MDESAMGNGESVRSALRTSDGQTFGFAFTDGSEMAAVVVSDSHLDVDDTLVLLRAGVTPGEPAWQVRLDEIAKLTAADGAVLYDRESTNRH